MKVLGREFFTERWDRSVSMWDTSQWIWRAAWDRDRGDIEIWFGPFYWVSSRINVPSRTMGCGYNARDDNDGDGSGRNYKADAG